MIEVDPRDDLPLAPALLGEHQVENALVALEALRQLGSSDGALLAALQETRLRGRLEWIDSNLGRDYAWPGNFRELEQCVRNVMIRRDYQPATRPRRDK